MNSAYTNIQTGAEQTFSSAFSACAQDVEYGSLSPVAAGLHVRWTHIGKFLLQMLVRVAQKLVSYMLYVFMYSFHLT